MIAGCVPPNQENIRLRRQVQELQGKLQSAQQQRDADQRTIAGLQQRSPTFKTLPSDELAKLFIPHGLAFGRLTGGARFGANQSADGGVKVYIAPTDENGTPVQAAGSFVVEAFDLAEPTNNRVGRWTFDVMQAKQLWHEFLVDYCYVLPCPWEKPPRHPDLTLKVTFTDQLTGAVYSAQREVHVDLPAASGGK